MIDVRARVQVHHRARRHHVGVLVVEQLEAVVPGRVALGEEVVLGDLVGRVAEPVDVDHEGDAGVLGQGAPVLDHAGRELVHDQQLLGQVVALDQGRQVRPGLVHDRCVGRADHLARDLVPAHAPLRVERQPHVRLAQVRLIGAHLVHEPCPARLDVENQQRLGPARLGQVAVDQVAALPVAVLAVVAGRGRDQGCDQLEGRHHRAAGAGVRSGLRQQLGGGRVGGADAELTEAGVLRGAVVGDDSVVRQKRAAAARLLRGRGSL